MDFLKAIENWKPKESDLRKLMGRHVLGDSPKELFEKRRPQESQQETLLTYRLENYRPFTVSEFKIALSDVISVANRTSYTLKDVELDIELIHNGVDAYDYVVNNGVVYSQLDNETILVPLPFHESMTELINENGEIFDFNTVLNDTVLFFPYFVESKYIVEISNNHVKFWYKEIDGVNYFILIDNDGWHFIYSDKNSSGKVIQIDDVFYLNEADGIDLYWQGFKFSVHDLPEMYGAAMWGDKSIVQDSDLQISERRFTFPRHYTIKVDCPEPTSSIKDGVCLAHDNTVCKTCNGAGYIADYTPFGSLLVQKDENGTLQAPEGFITPPIDILKHSAERVEYYFKQMKNALGITSQNETNQSGESKKYDFFHKENSVSNIVRKVYAAYEWILGYNNVQNGGEWVTIELPNKIDVLNESDLQVLLSESKASKVPDLYLRQIAKNMIGEGGNVRIIEWLSKYDKLFPYDISEISSVKSVLGAQLTDRDITLHFTGYELLKDLVTEGMSDQQITELANSLITVNPQIL